jgi:hypothetical protein
MRRTPALAAAALSRAQTRSPEDCLEQIARQHPTDVSPAFWHEVRAALPVQALPDAPRSE